MRTRQSNVGHRLSPASLQNHNLETEDAVSRRYLDDLARATKLGAAAYAIADSLCAWMVSPDQKIGPVCAPERREYRVWLLKALLMLVAAVSQPAKVITICFARVPLGGLEAQNLSAIKARLRTVLDRCGFSGSILVGGIEADFDSSRNEWVIHAHLLLMHPDDGALNNLRDHFRRRFGKRAVKVQELRDTSRQLSYLLKFVTYHRPGTQRGNARSKTVPLPDAAFIELMSWWNGHRCSDFLVAYGVRIVRGQFQVSAPTAPTNSTSPEFHRKR